MPKTDRNIKEEGKMREIRMSRQGVKGLCLLLTMLLIFWAVMPMGEVRAAQENHYHDPADNWLTAGNRTSELDANSVVTKETFTCFYCGKQTQFTVWRTPEYTKDGKSALSHNVMFSDGTMVDGKTVGSIMDGTPGVDAYYTGYHWSKAVCEMGGAHTAVSVLAHIRAKRASWKSTMLPKRLDRSWHIKGLWKWKNAPFATILPPTM